MPTPPLLNDCDQWINAWLGRTGCKEDYGTTTAANDVACRSGEVSNAAALIGVLLQHFADRWAKRGTTRQTPPGDNWKWRRTTDVNPNSTRIEEILNRRVVQCIEQGWANEIPTTSGVYDDHGGHYDIDLGFRDGGHLTFFELKWVYPRGYPNTQVYAALQLLAYACQWFLARQFAKEMQYCDAADGSLRPPLDAARVDWVVLAPEAFFQRHRSAGLERAINDALRDTARVRTPGIPMAFRFEQFHVTDGWQTDCEILRNMIEGRRPVYAGPAR